MTKTKASRELEKPRLLVLSHVLPFPRSAGQHQRVFYTLTAARDVFHVTFATAAHDPDGGVRRQLLSLCDDAVVLPPASTQTRMSRLRHAAMGSLYAAFTGLKRSNYAIGCVDFHSSRIAGFLGNRQFDCVLYEYWHAVGSAPVFQQQNIPCVLDMHDVLWKSYAAGLGRLPVPGWWTRWAVSQYRDREVRAWRQFDALVAINRSEHDLVRELVGDAAQIFHVPMGTDLGTWPYAPAPVTPPRVAFYGSFSSPANRDAAYRCVNEIMPRVWQRRPDAELWLVGSNPSESLVRLQKDPRVHVTGYLDDPAKVLRTMSAALCPWNGTWGFRSRLVEMMALGVPVVVTPDAVHGMDMPHGHGVLLGTSDLDLADHVVDLLNRDEFQSQQSRLARQHVENVFSLERTYGRWVHELDRWLQMRRRKTEERLRMIAAAATTNPSVAVH
jgi:glycosyltransferase involved in cell wall biosynthesis